MRPFFTALVSASTAMLLTGCFVDQDVVGLYAHPEAGVIVLGDDGDGSYVHFEGDVRAVPGNNQEPEPGTSWSGTQDDRPWDDTHLFWCSSDDAVTLQPDGGHEVRATHIEGGLILTVGSGAEAQDLTFVQQTDDE